MLVPMRKPTAHRLHAMPTVLILATQSSQPLTPWQLVVKQWSDIDHVTSDVNDDSVPANRPNQCAARFPPSFLMQF